MSKKSEPLRNRKHKPKDSKVSVKKMMNIAKVRIEMMKKEKKKLFKVKR